MKFFSNYNSVKARMPAVLILANIVNAIKILTEVYNKKLE